MRTLNNFLHGLYFVILSPACNSLIIFSEADGKFSSFLKVG